MKVYFYTLGCKVNQYETQEMSELLEKFGYTIIYNVNEADVIVVNSCTVTAESVRKTRQSIRKFRKTRPNSIIVLTGCASQAEPDIGSEIPEADILMGNKTNTHLPEAIEKYLTTHTPLSFHKEHMNNDSFVGTGITRFDGHTRAFLKIQDGCDRFCSYCLIPFARGRSRSKPLEDINKEIAQLAKNGYKEIVFVGINLSDYGKNTPYDLADALKQAENYDSIARIRLGSLEPDHITDKMIERLGEIKKLCPQFHISVQSGSNNVLRAMNRHYSAEYYEDLCCKIRHTFPDATITTDILVGFPTETEDDFNTTLEFVKRIRFEKVHVFPYSVRKGTRAEKLPQHTKTVKEYRASKLSEVTDKIRKETLDNYIGKTVSVLFEISKEDYTEGYTENYTPVRVYTDKICSGKILKVIIKSSTDDFCIGEIL